VVDTSLQLSDTFLGSEDPQLFHCSLLNQDTGFAIHHVEKDAYLHFVAELFFEPPANPSGSALIDQ